MAPCRDKTAKMLRTQNYNVVRHPREGIRPLQLIGKVGDAVQLLGGLDKLITNPPDQMPTITPDQAAAGLEGQQSDKQDIGVGLNFLGSVLKALSGTSLDLSAQYQQSHTLQFTFNDVVTDTVEPLDVGNYLKRGEVDVENLVIKQFVNGDGELYLITQTLKAKRITVRSEADKGTEVKVDVPIIKQVVGGKVGIAADADQASEITYSGDRAIVFGFQAFKVGVAGGVLSLVPAQAGSVSFGVTGEPPAPVVLEQADDDALLDLSVDPWEAAPPN